MASQLMLTQPRTPWDLKMAASLVSYIVELWSKGPRFTGYHAANHHRACWKALQQQQQQHAHGLAPRHLEAICVADHSSDAHP